MLITVVDESMQVAILAGGLGTGLGNLTEDRPKSLVEIGGKPFLQYHLEFLKERDNMILSRAPTIITLGGGGTDPKSRYSKYGGFLIAGERFRVTETLDGDPF